MEDLDTTGYRLTDDTDILVANGALTEGFTAVQPARMNVCLGFRGCRIIPIGATATGGTGGQTTLDLYGVDVVNTPNDPKGWIITKIAVSSLITFSGAVATAGRPLNLRLPSVLATFTEDASFTDRRTYSTGLATLGVPDANAAPIFECMVPDLTNFFAIICQFETAFAGSLANANAYVAFDR